jgi:hypothetical protein
MRVRLAALGSLMVLLAGCGIASQDHAHLEADDAVPFDLLDSTTSSTASVVPGRPGTVATRICLVDPSDHIVAVARDMPPSFTLSDLVTAVGAGPTANERAGGWTTALSGQDLIDSTGLTGGVAEIGLTEQFTATPSTDQLKAIAQLVCTLTEQRGIGQIQFTVAGSSAEVPRGDGSATTDPVSRGDYAGLIADAPA